VTNFLQKTRKGEGIKSVLGQCDEKVVSWTGKIQGNVWTQSLIRQCKI